MNRVGRGEGQGCQDDSFQLEEEQQNPENLGGRWRLLAKFGKARENSTHMLYASLSSIIASKAFCQGVFYHLLDYHTFFWFTNYAIQHSKYFAQHEIPLACSKSFKLYKKINWLFPAGQISIFSNNQIDCQRIITPTTVGGNRKITWSQVELTGGWKLTAGDWPTAADDSGPTLVPPAADLRSPPTAHQ